jgi:hypothetical protein
MQGDLGVGVADGDDSGVEVDVGVGVTIAVGVYVAVGIGVAVAVATGARCSGLLEEGVADAEVQRSEKERIAAVERNLENIYLYLPKP